MFTLKSYKVNKHWEEPHITSRTHYHFSCVFPSAITSIIYILNTKHNMKTSSVVKVKTMWRFLFGFGSLSWNAFERSLKWIVFYFLFFSFCSSSLKTKTMKIQKSCTHNHRSPTFNSNTISKKTKLSCTSAAAATDQQHGSIVYINMRESVENEEILSQNECLH